MAQEPDTRVPTERNRPDYDADAVTESRSAARAETPRSECGRCHKPIYREPSYPGVPLEWKHVSSGQPLSWQPTKHMASLTTMREHAHRFPPPVRGKSLCVSKGCDAELRAYKPKPADDSNMTEREKADDISRRRGGARGRATQHKTLRF